MVSTGKLLSSVNTTVDEIVDNNKNKIDAINGAVKDFKSFVNNSLNVNANPTTGNSLPYTNVRPTRENAVIKRNIIHWFIPEIGVVEMYVNPNSIGYSQTKLISKDKTKNGFALQYFGEDLLTLNISGTTGSSGIEGINVLNEVYRAEQLAFDPMAIQLYAASNDISNQIGSLFGNGIAGAIGSAVGSAIFGGGGNTGLAGGINNNVPTLASVAFGIEMYYMGMVYRGYFTSMSFNERADNFLWDYSMNFIVIQKRGYRGNYFNFHRPANQGPSNNVYSPGASLGVPLSFK